MGWLRGIVYGGVIGTLGAILFLGQPTGRKKPKDVNAAGSGVHNAGNHLLGVKRATCDAICPDWAIYGG
jgi:hypothetical protein